MDGGRVASRDENGFKPHEQYRVIHGRSHRKSPSRVGTPALTRHLAFWIPPTPDAAASNFRKERETWVARIDWFLASLILNAYEQWQGKLNKALLLESSTVNFARRWRTLLSHIPMSFNAEDPRINAEDPPRYLFQFFRHTALYHADSLLDRGSVRFQKNDEVKQEETEYLDLSGNGIWDSSYVSMGLADDDESDGASLAEGDRFETVSFRLFHGVIPVKVRAELHTEYFTLSFTAELDVDESMSWRAGGDPRVQKIEEHFKVLSGIVNRRWRESAKLRTRTQEGERARKDVMKAMEPCSYLVEEFWREIDREFIHPAFTPTIPHPLAAGSQRTDKQESIRDRLGQYITDCRGLVLSVDKDEKGAWALMMPFVSPKRTTLRDYVGLDKKFDDGDAIDVFGLIEPIVDAARQASSSDVIRKAAQQRPDKRVFEYAVSAVQRRRGLYISALAPQPLWSEEHDPLCYFVLTRHRHRWQIGRFLDRMNMLGTLRVASLMEYPSLNRAGYKLRDLDRRLNNLRQTNISFDEKREDSARMHEEYSEILRSVPEGGLLYRADRSLFYMRNFRAECDAMKFDRVEGFQAYPSFVHRRLSQTWDFVAVLKQRAEQVGERLGAVSNDVRAEQEFAQTEKIQHLSNFAEKAATIPIAYYGGHAFEHLFHPSVGHAIWTGLKAIPLYGMMMPVEPNEYHPYLAIYMVLAGLLYLGVMHWAGERRKAAEKKVQEGETKTEDSTRL